jgi:hypothetical protein
MDMNHCQLVRYAEESIRERELGWFQLYSNEVGHVQIDLRHIPNNMVYNEHYKIAIFALPSRCDIEICSDARVRLTPEEFLPCRKPMILSDWFEDSSVPKNVISNITIFALDDMIFKVEIEILYGLYIPYKYLFQNTTTVRIQSPSRAKAIDGTGSYSVRSVSNYISFNRQLFPMQYFFCAVYYKDTDSEITQPLNMPPLYAEYERGRALLMYNKSDEATNIPLHSDDRSDVKGINFWTVPSPTDDQAKEMLDAYFEHFHETKFINDGFDFATFEKLLLPYLPFFSNCDTFDSYVPIWLLWEGQECQLPQTQPRSWRRYKYPALPDQDDIKSVGPFDFFEEPVADWCERVLKCHYEEDLENIDSTPRWFEVETGTALFDLLRYPVNYKEFHGRPSEQAYLLSKGVLQGHGLRI